MKSSRWLQLSTVLLVLGLPVQAMAEVSSSSFQGSGLNALSDTWHLTSDTLIAEAPIPSGANPDVVILAPIESTVLNVPSTPLLLRYGIGSRVEVRVNGSLADPSLVGHTETDTSTGLETQTWYGLSQKDGSNTIEVTATRTENGKPVVSRSQVVVQVRGNPISLRLSTV